MTRPTPTVLPGFAYTVSPVWQRSGVLVRSLSSFTGDRRDAAHAAGYRAVAIQLLHTDDLAGNLHELTLLRPEFQRRGWSIVGWGTFGQDTDARQDGIMSGATTINLNLDGWIGDGEKWCEGDGKDKTQAFVDGWDTKAGPSVPLMLTCESTVTSNYGPDMDFSPFNGYGRAISPQVYSASYPEYTLPAMRAGFAKTNANAKRIVPMLNVVKDQPVPRRYGNWVGPRWLYAGEDTLPEQFALTMRRTT